MKIAFFGLKGLPARFGGLQFDAEEIGERLVSRDHDVSVYCRKWYTGSKTRYRGMALIVTPTIPSRFTDIFVHTLTSAWHAMSRNYDIAHFYSFASYLFIPLLKMMGCKTVITMGGEPWNDITLNRAGRWIEWLAYHVGCRFADAVMAESLPLKIMTEEKFMRQVYLTPVGGQFTDPIEPNIMTKKYGLEKDRFVLFIGRLERVKRLEWLIGAFKKINPSDVKLVIAGDTKDRAYRDYLSRLSEGSDNIVFTGFVSGRLKAELFSNCRFMVLPSVSEGMPTSIIEAFGFGKVCLVSDIAPHQWIVDNDTTGFLFKTEDFNDLVEKMKRVLSLECALLSEIGKTAKRSAQDRFDWDAIVNTIEDAYFKIRRS